ncbi:MAG: site-2 protease family protein [Candidatus Thermoplasmatota archaeon]
MSETWTTPDSSPIFDIELLKREVGQRFPFYDMKTDGNTAVFFCRVDELLLEEKFEQLRVSLAEKGYIPMIRFEGGEHLIYIIKKPLIRKKPVWINLALLIATVFTTTLAGSLQWVSILEPTLNDFIAILSKSFSPEYLSNGFLFFSIPLLLILGCHEMGHYLISKKHNVESSLPYFIPLPPPFILGTFGAVISTREPIPNRKALLDIGIAGPLAGFLVAIPVCFVGFFLMQQNPISIPQSENIGYMSPPLIIQWIQTFFSLPDNILIHPTLFAGWVGIFLTAVNLLPVGQLDGGHVARAFLKEKHRYASWAVVIILLILGLLYTGWLMFALIVFLLIGTHHQPPLNEHDTLDTRRKLLGVLIIIVFILSFAPIPFS